MSTSCPCTLLLVNVLATQLSVILHHEFFTQLSQARLRKLSTLSFPHSIFNVVLDFQIIPEWLDYGNIKSGDNQSFLWELLSSIFSLNCVAIFLETVYIAIQPVLNYHYKFFWVCLDVASLEGQMLESKTLLSCQQSIHR